MGVFGEILTIVALFALILGCFALYYDEDYVVEGIENYAYPYKDSKLGWLCNNITLRYETDKTPDSDRFINKYQYTDAFFRGEHKGETYGFDLSFELTTVFLCISYSPDTYTEALNDVRNQVGFSEKVSFSFCGYDFSLNRTSLKVKELTDGCSHDDEFNLQGENRYIQTISLVGKSNDSNRLVFIGFSYYKSHHHRGPFGPRSISYYDFTGWDVFFSDFFSFYDWK